MRPSWFHQLIEWKRHFLRNSRAIISTYRKNVGNPYKKKRRFFSLHFFFLETINLIWSFLNLFRCRWLRFFYAHKLNGTWKKSPLIWFNYSQPLILVHFLRAEKKWNFIFGYFFLNLKKNVGFYLYILRFDYVNVVQVLLKIKQANLRTTKDAHWFLLFNSR